MKIPKGLRPLAAGVAALAATGCTPDISDKVEEIICNTGSVAGQFTRAGNADRKTGTYRGNGRGRAVKETVVIQDVNRLHRGHLERKAGILPGHLCEVRARFPQMLASFDPTAKDSISSDHGNLHFKASGDISRLEATHPVPTQLQRNDGVDWNFLWIIDPRKNNDHQDSQYAYEIAKDDQVHGGFVGTVKDLSEEGFGNRLQISSYANLYEQGDSKPMTLNEFLEEVR